MRDKKDDATYELPGFGPASAQLVPLAATRRTSAARQRNSTVKQHQLALLDDTDASGLPVWRRDDDTDLTGLPNWAAA
ncbi:MAG: hypothetical protein WKG03_06815 [Telluria sp.]